MLFSSVGLAGLLTALGLVSTAALAAAQANVTIPGTHPLIHYHGRWDALNGAWWCAPSPPLPTPPSC